MALRLHNTLGRKRQVFKPLDAANVTLYACGPTVYERPHLGNARAVVVYDMLFRILRLIYGESAVTYARNITDVDDKIIVAARAKGVPIQQLTQTVIAQFHEDMAMIGCLSPTYEPRATEYLPQMTAMIQQLIEQGAAYESEGHVLFSVASQPGYGQLSGRKLEDLVAGARVDVASYKRDAGDFVLWKPAAEGDDVSACFESPWGTGRPGWHIECSAMSTDLLGANFDIHGGGADLQFPHHENEIAQSCAAHPGSDFARFWVHNGFLTVVGEKMSKSLGNFITVHDLLQQGIAGEVIRLVFLMTKYNEPLNWQEKTLSDAKKMLDGWYRKLDGVEAEEASLPSQAFIDALCDDMNLPAAIALMHSAEADQLRGMASLLGLCRVPPQQWFKGDSSEDDAAIQAQIDARITAKKERNFSLADTIRQSLEAEGIILEDKRDGSTDWRRE